MQTECVECGAPASRFVGRLALCKRHAAAGLDEDPKAHSCPRCHEEHPPHVLWMGDRPCGKCQAAGAGEVTS